MESNPGIGIDAMAARIKAERPELRDAVSKRAVRVSKAAILEAEGARAEAEEGLAALREPLDAGEESAVEPGGGAARGTAPASRGTIETGTHRAAPERPPRANSADIDEVHEEAATAREASGGALVAVGRWWEAVLRLRSGGTQPIGEYAAL